MSDSDTRLAGTPIRRGITAAAVALSAAAFVVIAPAAGHASVLACTTSSGLTSNLALGPNGPHPVGGKIWIKQPPGCLDLNLLRAPAGDHYEGWLENTSTGEWSHCSAGFLPAPPPNRVLCSSVKTGTPMAVVQESGTQRTVTVEY
jgi:hypothetical protein